jgi:hypothetical protein
VIDAVERPRDRGRGAKLRVDDDDVLRRHRSPPELREHRSERLARASTASAPRQHVARPPEHVQGLLEPELADVARDRRLRDLTAGFPERSLQLVLAADPPATDDARDQALALVLRKLPTPVHAGENNLPGFRPRKARQATTMLRKVLWSTLYTGFAAGFALAARQAAAVGWRLATGETPPEKR